MRISDWSSDVCSSDLLSAAATVRRGSDTVRGCGYCVHLFSESSFIMADETSPDLNNPALQPNGEDTSPAIGLISQYVKDLSFENPNAPAVYQWQEAQIGRASCRERVGQYV